MELLSKKASLESTRPSFLMAPDSLSNASERVVFPGSTCAKIPVASLVNLVFNYDKAFCWK